MGKERARQMAIAVLTSGSACDLLAHNREYRLRPPAVALYHTLELGASVRRHAEPIDYDVTDLVLAVACAHAPIDLKRLAVPRPRAGLMMVEIADPVVAQPDRHHAVAAVTLHQVAGPTWRPLRIRRRAHCLFCLSVGTHSGTANH